MDSALKEIETWLIIYQLFNQVNVLTWWKMFVLFPRRHFKAILNFQIELHPLEVRD